MLDKFTTPLKEFGIFAGALYLLDRLLAGISPNLRLFCYELMVQPIPDKPMFPVSMTKSLDIREIKRGDPELDLMPVPPEIIEFRLKQNAICLGVFKKAKFIGYIWFRFGAYEEDEVRCAFLLVPENEAVFDFDLYLFPEHRLGLGFIGIWEKANKFLYERGIRYTFSRLTRFNLASRKAHNHLGWKRVGQAFFLKAWRLELMISTIAPYLGLSLGESGRINLKLRPDVLRKG